MVGSPALDNLKNAGRTGGDLGEGEAMLDDDLLEGERIPLPRR